MSKSSLAHDLVGTWLQRPWEGTGFELRAGGMGMAIGCGGASPIIWTVTDDKALKIWRLSGDQVKLHLHAEVAIEECDSGGRRYDRLRVGLLQLYRLKRRSPAGACRRTTTFLCGKDGHYMDDSITTYRIQENIVNISMAAALLIKDGAIDTQGGDTELASTIIDLAHEFHRDIGSKVDYNAEPDFDDLRDYWIEIEDFAEEKLTEKFKPQ